MRILTLILIILIGTALVFTSLSCSRNTYSVNTETLTIAAVPTELNALVYIAKEQKFFADNGLNIVLKDYDSGASAASGMLNGEADIALAAEFPIVRHILNKKNIVNFGTITRYENTYILWRSGSGIKTIQDLKGKKIGVTLTTISEFYLGRTLDLNGINIKQVTLVDTKAADAEKALTDGMVDAVVTWEPWVTQTKQHIPEGVIMKAAQSAQYAYWNLVSTAGWTENHGDIIIRLLKSLDRAEIYLENHQDEAKRIVRRQMNFDEAYLDITWPRYQFSISLDQSLVVAMEDETRWMICNNMTSEKHVPDFSDYIYEDALKGIKPEAVSIIR